MPLSLLEGEEYRSFYFVTHTGIPSEQIDIAYEKCSNAEKYIKEAKEYRVVGHLLLQSFWANEAILPLMMHAYNHFLLFKMNLTNTTEYRQPIKASRLKYKFLTGKSISMARSVVLKRSTNDPIYAKAFHEKTRGGVFPDWLIVVKQGGKKNLQPIVCIESP